MSIPRTAWIAALWLLWFPAHGWQEESLSSVNKYIASGDWKAARVAVDPLRFRHSDLVVQSMAFSLSGLIFEEEGYLDSAQRNYEQGLLLAHRNGSPQALAAALNGVSSVYLTIGRYDSIPIWLAESRRLDDRPANQIRSYLIEARFRQTQNDYDGALESLQAALPLAENLRDERHIPILLSNIGGIYFSHNPDMKFAIEYYDKAIKACDSTHQTITLARTLGRMANAYMVLGDGVNAKRYLTRALQIVAKIDNLPVKAYVLSSQATWLHEEGRYEESLAYLEEPIRIKRVLGQRRQLQNDLLNVSETYIKLRKYAQADAALREAETIAKSLHDVVYLKYLYDRRAMLDSARGDFSSAYVNLRTAIAYKDSTFSAQHFRDVREVQEKYEAEQKEKLIAEKELELEQHRNRQVITVAAASVVVLAVLIILLWFRSRSKSRLQQLRLQTIVKTQEEVQQRIARDLHDGLVQVLGAAKLALQTITPSDDPKTIAQVRSASSIIDEAVDEARSISHQALPYSLLKEGLVSALDELFLRSLPSYTFRRPDSINISEEKAVHIFRIAQEVVNNIRKHSEANNVDVSILVEEGVFVLVFVDDGKGFDPESSHRGAGLSNMNTRAELMGGAIHLKSLPGKGTTTELVVPL